MVQSSTFAKQDANDAAWNIRLAPLGLADRLKHIGAHFPAAVFTTSLGFEDQIITAAIAELDDPLHIVTLETGRLFPQTLELLERTSTKYKLQIERFHPEHSDVEDYALQYGLNGFYDSIEARHACCNIRKIVPLRRALSNADAWVTGLRREQSSNRSDVPFAEWSADYGLMKFNPLADWSNGHLHDAIAADDIPVNPLHARGYPSIGCEPCTRAIRPGEPERAGRWWWENEDTRECGLHVAEAEVPATRSHTPPDTARTTPRT